MVSVESTDQVDDLPVDTQAVKFRIERTCALKTELAVFVQTGRVECFYPVQGDGFEVERFALSASAIRPLISNCSPLSLQAVASIVRAAMAHIIFFISASCVYKLFTKIRAFSFHRRNKP